MRQSKQVRQAGFLSLPNDNVVKTIGVATLLCLVCSIIVAVSATALKPKQVENKLLDKKTNILRVAGLNDSSKTVEERFSQIKTIAVNLNTGQVTDKVDPLTYDQRKASKDPAMSTTLSKAQDIAVIKTRADFASVYLLQDGDDIQKIILPIKGYGLWSTLYGFIALEGDATTVSGITFYEHGETPGLGGEIENPKWQASWQGKEVLGENGTVALEVIKGAVGDATPKPEHKIDGLAGATLTSNGVSNMIAFWLGKDGFGPYLDQLRQASGSTALSSERSVDEPATDNEQVTPAGEAGVIL